MVQISEERKVRIIKALMDKEVDVTIDWYTATIHNQSQVVSLKCNKCGTSHNRAVSSLSRGSFHCPTCTVKGYTIPLASVNFQYIAHNGTTIRARCIKCETITSLPNSTVLRNNTPKCQPCLDTRYTLLVSNLGFDYVGVAPYSEHGSQTLVVKCKKDQTITLAAVSSFNRGYVRCNECQTNKYRHELSLKNCSLVGTDNKTLGAYKVKSVEYRNLKGETFKATSGHIMQGDFATTKDGQWHDTHSTYLIRNIFEGSTYYKIGTAKTPEQRLKDLKLLGESSVVHLESFPDRFGADKLETVLHREFKQFKLDSNVAETFTGRIRKVKRVGEIERVRIKEGITEWFTHEVYDVLKTRYNLEKEENESNSDTIREVTGTG